MLKIGEKECIFNIVGNKLIDLGEGFLDIKVVDIFSIVVVNIS